jgi:hypothetical protein
MAIVALIIETAVVTALVAFRGVRPVRFFLAFLCANLAVFAIVFLPILKQGWIDAPLLEFVVMGIDCLSIRWLGSLGLLRTEKRPGVTWDIALLASILGNAASYLIGHLEEMIIHPFGIH